jgi:hypothetical protein
MMSCLWIHMRCIESYSGSEALQGQASAVLTAPISELSHMVSLKFF